MACASKPASRLREGIGSRFSGATSCSSNSKARARHTGAAWASELRSMNSARSSNCATTSNAMPRTLSIRISNLPDALDRFEAAWHLATGREAPPALQRLAFADLPLLLKTLTSARWQLLASLRTHGPLSVRALAKLLARDYK